MMVLEYGLMDGQVLQRNRRNCGSASLGGTCDAAGVVECRVSGIKKGALTVWSPAGKASGGRFKASLGAVPAGGPYRADLRIRGSGGDALGNILFYVGDVWFMAGQSNMQGSGSLAEAAAPHPLVRCLYMNDTWGQAKDPLHFPAGAVDPVHHLLKGRSAPPPPDQVAAEFAALTKGAGLGIPFARRMAGWTGVPQGLVACAHGGTRMDQWDPARRDEGGFSLYGALVRRFRKLGQAAAGVLWYQGESDAHEKYLREYTPRMIDLVAAMRRDFRQPGLPWIAAQISRHLVDHPPGDWNAIQEQQRLLPESIRNLEVVPTMDLELEDSIHLAAKGLERLGERMFHAARRLVFKDSCEKGAIRLRRITVRTRRKAAGASSSAVEVVFDHVEGGLRAGGGLPWGFSTAAPDGSSTEVFCKARLEGHKVILEALPHSMIFDALDLYYARGRNTAATIVDGRGMGIPAFGPVPITVQRGTRFVLNWQVVRIGPSGMPVADFKSVPEALESWAPAVRGAAASAFMVFPRPITDNRDGTFLFRCVIAAERQCRVRLMMGTDSPFQTWLNGRPVVRDGKGANPCLPGQYDVPVSFRKGANRIDTVFDAREGRGWGISLRFRPAGKEAIPDGLLTW